LAFLLVLLPSVHGVHIDRQVQATLAPADTLTGNSTLPARANNYIILHFIVIVISISNK